MRPAIFLDRDGVINENRSDYVKSWAEFRFLPGALEALRRLAVSRRRVVVVTNQSVVGRGIIRPDQLVGIHREMIRAIDAAGGHIEALYVCPHAPDAGCDCRKPAPGLLLRAAAERGILLPGSVLIGDNLSDVAAARAAGVRPLLVRSDLERDRPRRATVRALPEGCLLVDDLAEAVASILSVQCLDAPLR